MSIPSLPPPELHSERKVASQTKGGNRVNAYHNAILARMVAAGWLRRPAPPFRVVGEWLDPTTGVWMTEHQATLTFMATQPRLPLRRTNLSPERARELVLRRAELRALR